MTQTANNYGRVLYELSIPNKEIEASAELLNKEPRLIEFLKSPIIARKHKYAVIDKVFEGKLAVFIKLICRYGKVEQLTEAFEAYREYYAKQHGIMRAQVYVVKPLREAEKEQMIQFLKGRFSCEEVLLEEKRDENLLGGYLLKAGGMEYDHSYEGRLRQLEKKLT